MADTGVGQMSQCETQMSCVCLTAKLEQKCFGGWKLNVFYKLVSSVHVGTEADMAEKLLLLLFFPKWQRDPAAESFAPSSFCVCF